MIAGLPVRIIGVHGEAGFNAKPKLGFVLEAESDGVVPAVGGELHLRQPLALHLRESKHPPARSNIFFLLFAEMWDFGSGTSRGFHRQPPFARLQD